MKPDITPSNPRANQPAEVLRGASTLAEEAHIARLRFIKDMDAKRRPITDVVRQATVEVTTTVEVDTIEDGVVTHHSGYFSFDQEVITPEVKGEQSFPTRTSILSEALDKTRSALKTERKKRIELKRFGIVLLAGILVLVTGYVSIDTWMTNNRVKAETSQPTAAVATAVVHTKDQEGKDESPVSVDLLKSYTVAASLPRAIYINKINVSARVMPMSINADGSVQAPRNIFDAGWYNGSVQPGEIGAMFIDGHASGATREGLFAYLDKLVEGDTLEIEKGDGSRLAYRVVHTETVNLSDVDMKKLLLPYGNTVRGMNLMTCTGNWVADQETYDKRVTVYTEQI